MKLNVLYEDSDIIVVEKPAGIESQSARSFEPDMVSEVKKHINTLSPKSGEAYVGVIHRLDKPVSGIMVYAKTKEAAASLSKQVQEHKMTKIYQAIVCGKPVDNSGTYVDYLWKDGKNNISKIVDKGITGGKLSELSYLVLRTIGEDDQELSLVEIELKTGRHHQIRVQFAGHGYPLWADQKYNPQFKSNPIRENVALCAASLSFCHPKTKKRLTFSIKPCGAIFDRFLI